MEKELNGWIKDVLMIDFDLKNTDNIHKLIKEYVKCYNNIRLVCSLKSKSPIQF